MFCMTTTLTEPFTMFIILLIFLTLFQIACLQTVPLWDNSVRALITAGVGKDVCAI